MIFHSPPPPPFLHHYPTSQIHLLFTYRASTYNHPIMLCLLFFSQTNSEKVLQIYANA